MKTNKQTGPSVDGGDFLGTSSYAAYSSEAAHSDSTAHYSPLYAPDCPWNSYDNVPPTPAAAFLDDPEIEVDHQIYHMEPVSCYDHPETALHDAGSTGSETPPRPVTPMGALATPPRGYEWYVSSTYEAYLVPLPGTASTSGHGNSTSTGVSATLAPYGLPTPPPEPMLDFGHSRVSKGRRILPEWLSADSEQKLVDVLDEKDQVWTRKKQMSTDSG